MRTISVKELMFFCEETLKKAGLSEENAEIAAQALVTTDTFGVMSHGTKNLYQYIQKMQMGGLDAKAEPSVEREGISWAIVNGNAALGMITAAKAMMLAVEKAKKTGIAYVGVKNSCHFGAAGYYANLAARQGLIGISMSNADPNMSVPNASQVAIGNNPFSFAVPVKSGRTVFLDIALSNVAALKVVMAKEKKQKVPLSWLVDEDGNPTDDPAGFPEKSHLQPMGGHKGYGLAVLVEILASVLTGAGILSEVASWNLRMTERNLVGHAFIAVDISQIMGRELFEERMEQMICELKNTPLAKGAVKIYLPGEMEWDRREKVLEEKSLTLTDSMVENIEKLSELMEIPVNWLE